ncbi:hypothetical protein [Pantoea agglomerans]|uniref:hypothetical protein n=1 Tax=Enterobacter agglomerans TaxID=549 RepID=UPI003EC095FF
MKTKLICLVLLIAPAFSYSKTVSDFINEHPDLANQPVIKSAIQQGAIGNAGLDAMSNGSGSETLSRDSQRLLKEKGYEYAIAAIRDLSVSACGEGGLADVYGFKEKDCQIIQKLDSEIE